MASLPGWYNQQFFKDNGDVAANWRVYTYAAGTTTHKVAYTDPAGLVPQTYTSDGLGGQYIALNARGELAAPIFLGTGGYDIVLKDDTGATEWTRYAIGSEAEAAALDTALLARLAATTAGNGASMIGVEDAGGYYPETNVEDVLEGLALRAYCIELEAYRNLVTQVGGEDRWDAAFAAAQTAAIAQKKPIFLGSNPVVKYFTTTWNLTATDTSKDGLTIFGAGIRWSKPYWRNTTGACIEVQGVDRLCLKDFQIAGDGPVGIAGGRQSTRQWNGRQWLQNVMVIMPDNMAYNSGIGSIAYLGIEPEESTYDCCEFWANLPVFIGPPNQINVRTFTTAGALTTTRSMTWTPTYNPIVGTLVSNTVFHFQGGCRMVAWQPDSPPVVLRSASTVDLGNSFLQMRCPNNPAKDMKKCPFAIDASNVWNLKWFGTFERGSNEASPDGLTDVGALLVDGSAENWTVSANAGTAAAAGVTLNLVPCIYAIDATGGQWRHNEIKLRLNGNIAQYPISFSNATAATTQIQNCSFDIGSTAALSTIPQPFLFNMSGSTIRLLGANSVSPVVLEKPARYTHKLIVGKELGASAAATTVATIVLPVSGISSGSATFENVTLNAGYLAGSANTALISGGFEVCWTRTAATTGLAVTVTRTDWGTSVKTSAGSLDIAAPTITAVLSGQASFQIQVASNLSGTGTAGVTTRMDADLTVTAAFGVNASTATVTTQ